MPSVLPHPGPSSLLQAGFFLPVLFWLPQLPHVCSNVTFSVRPSITTLCMTTPSHGSSIPWILHYKAPPPHGHTIPWLLHPMAPPSYGSSIAWLLHPMASPSQGSSTPWLLHPMAPPYLGSSIPWPQHHMAAPSEAPPSHGSSIPWLLHPKAPPSHGSSILRLLHHMLPSTYYLFPYNPSSQHTHTYGPSFPIDGSSPHFDKFKLPALKVRSPDQHVELI